jgi:predicted metallopeptidase
MKYHDAPDLKLRMIEIVNLLAMDHIDLDRIECIRSTGSSTRRTLARVHTLGKLMQKAMKTKAFYAIEFLERFEKLSEEDKDKVIIHELLHVPKTFGGGFRQHDFVCEDNVELMYDKFLNLKERNSSLNDFSRESNKVQKEESERRMPFFWR